MRLKHFLSVFLTLLTLSVGQMWGANSGLTASAGTFILDFYNSEKLTSSNGGIDLSYANCTTHVTIPKGVTSAGTIVTNCSKNGTVQFDKMGGLTFGKSSNSDSYATFTIANDFPIRKISVVATKWANIPLYVDNQSVAANNQSTAYANCTSHDVTTNYITSLKIANKSNTGSNAGRVTLYTAVCEYGYRATLTQPSEGSISAVPKTGTAQSGYENGAGWNSTLGAVVGLKSTQKVTLSASAPNNKEFDHWTVKTTASPYTDVTADVLSGDELTMPAYDVTVTVTWRNAATAYNITEQSNNTDYGTVSLNGSVITGAPATCYEYDSPAYTVSPAGNATITQGTGDKINEFTVSDVTSDVTVTINFKAKGEGKTVNFNAGPGVAASTSLTEDCAGAGVTLPTVNVSTLCKGWGTFAGWRATAIAAADSSTTTNPGTLYAAGSNYKPSSDGETLYAVYSKVKSGGTAEETASVSISSYATAHSWANETKYTTVNIDANITATAAGGGNTGKYYTNGTNWRFYQTENATLTISAATGCTLKSATFTYGISNTGVLKDGNTTVSSGSAYSISGTSKEFSVGNSSTATNGQVKFTAISVTYDKPSSTTYYCSDPNCCLDLGAITGVVTLEQLTEGVNAGKLQASWPSQTTTAGWASPGIVIKIYEDGNATPVVTSDALANNTTSFTATGFTPKTCTQYYATLTATHGSDASYCAGDLVSDPSAKVTTAGYGYTNNSTNVNLVAALPASTCANGGADVDIQFTAATGYRLPTTDEEIEANVSVTNAGEKDEDWFCSVANDVLTISLSPSKATGNIGITVNGIVTVVPQITVSTDEINFNEVKKGTPTSTTFTVEGANLNSANITLSYSATEGDDDVFTFSKTTLIPSDYANPGIEITLTANTSAAGEYYGTITISDGNAGATDKTIDIYLTVLETYTVNWYVNGTKIDANSKTDVTGTEVTAPSDFSAFTDCSELHFVGWATSAIAVAGTTTEPGLVTPITAIGTTATTNYYAVFAEGTPGGTENVFEETFADAEGTAGWSGNGKASGAIAFDNDGWSSDKAYGNNGSARFGTSSAIGYAITPAIDVDGSATLTFKSGAWTDDKTTNGLVLTVEDGTATLTPSTFTLTNAEWDDNEVAITDAEGPIKIKFSAAQASKNRFFLDDIVVSQTSAPVYTKWYTTCPHVSRVTLSAPEVSNGSISFAQDSKAVTSVRTDGGADVDVNVVPDPATGYELTGVALSGTAASHASYDAGVITIDADAEGALTATATFAQANYTVTMAQTGGASAELSENQSGKHYNDVITVTAEDKAGYVFKGWSASPAVTFANAKALSTTFSMPNGNVTVTAAYAKVYTPAEALALDDLTDSVYVEGVISQVDEVSTQFKNATYWISANGTTTNQIKIFRGKHLNNGDVTVDNAAQIAVGNKVRVRGKLSQSSNVNQFGQGASYITVLVEKTLSGLTIVGDASVTTYDVGDSFDKTGLSLSATYNTGYVQANYTGTTITSNYDAPTAFTAGVTSVTVSAEEGLISTSRDIDVTVSSAVLDHVVISADAQTEFWAKEQYKEPLLDAYLTDEPATVLHNVTGVSNTTGLDMSVTGNKSVTVTYTRKVGQTDDVTYNFTVKPIAVDEANAHSVATAREIIDLDNDASEDLDLELAATKTYVIGVVTSVNALTGSNAGKYTIVIKDQTDASKTMELYKNTLGSGVEDVKVGDLIKAHGNLYWFASGSKYEINEGGEIVAVVRTPNLTVADVAEMEINITADLAEADLTIDKDGSEGAITFSCSDAAVTIVNNKLHAAAAGDATVTATIAADGIYTEASTTFNVHVIAERTRYAITMDANGGSGTDPVYANQLEGATVDLPASCPYSKANSAFDAWVVTETVSGDAVAVTDGHFTMPAAAVTIKATWNEVETCRISFQVSGSEVATADAPQTVAYTLSQTADDVNGYEFVGWAESEETEDVETVLTTISSYTPALNEDSKILYAVFRKSVDGGEVTDEITNAELAATDNAYTAFTNVTISTSAVYAGTTSKSNGIQMNADSPKGMVTTTTGGLLKNISIEWNSNCAADRVLDVYAKNTAYAGSSDLWGAAAAQGTKVTSFTNNGSTTSYDFVTDYAYIGVRSNDKALNLNKISITWETAITYYTTNPVAKYNIKYRAGEAENVTGLCDADRTWGTITLCDAPTCADKNFVKWSDGTSLYDAGAEYTLSADVTFTATWTPKPTYNVTYNTSGSQGTTPTDATNYYEGDEVTLASASGLSNAGYFFDQWVATYVDGNSDTQTLVIEDGKFTMPAFNVTVTATWARKSSDKWIKVTATSQLTTGKEYIIVNTDATYAIGGQNTNNRAAATVENNAGILTISDAVAKFTLGIPEADKYTLYQNGTVDNVDKGYLYAASSGSNYMRTQVENNANGVWTISMDENGAATVTATGENTRNIMRYNPNNDSPMFSCYASTSTVQNPVVLYYKAPKIEINDSESVNVSDAAGSDIVIHEGGILTVDATASVGDLTVEAGGQVVLAANKLTVVGTFIIETTMASGTSGQLTGATASNFATNGPAYIDITLGKNGDPNQWHAFTVPFPVDAINGIYDLDGKKLANEVNYAIMDYHGDIRATGKYGWKKYRGVLVPGTFYLMTVDGERTTYRFKKTANGALAAGNSKEIFEYAKSGDGQSTDAGWNGIGNPTLTYGKVNAEVQVLDPVSYTYIKKDPNSTNFVVGTPFFYQASEAGSLAMLTADAGASYAPARTQDKGIEKIKVSFGNEEFTDYLDISASEEALNEYQIGKDLAKMTMTSTPKVAQIFGKAYNAKLCMVYAPMSNDQAVYDLSLYAPNAGEYVISCQPSAISDQYIIYLTKDGNIIWDLSMGEYINEFAKGNNEGYGLLLKAKAPQTPTGVEQSEVSRQPSDIQKIIIDDNVFILRGGQMYDVTGKAVK